MERIKEVDGLKVFFTCAVVLFHYNFFAAPSIPMPIDFVFKYGYLGVEFFFMSSGLMTAYRYKDSLLNDHTQILPFIKRRLLNIYPHYFFAVLFGFVISIIDTVCFEGKVVGIPIDLWTIFLSFAMIKRGWIEEGINPYGGVTWFVGVLFLCYIIYACLIQILRKKTTAYPIIILAWGGVGWMCINGNYDIPFLRHDNGRAYLSFAMGLLLSECLQYYRKANMERWRIYKNLLIGVLLLLPVTLFMSIRRGYENVYGNVDLCYTIIFIPTIIASAFLVSLFGSILKTEVIQKLYLFSESVFYTHFTVLFMLRMVSAKSGISFFGAHDAWKTFSAVIAVGVAWHYLIENYAVYPFRRLLSRVVK